MNIRPTLVRATPSRRPERLAVVDVTEPIGCTGGCCGSGRPPLSWRAKAIAVALALATLALVLLGPESLTGRMWFEPGSETGCVLAFVMGLVTGLHCIGMCGGIVLAYSTGRAGALWPAHVAYALGKTLSYTAVGAVCGGLGAAASLGAGNRGLVGVVSGVAMVVSGLTMMGIPLRFGTRRGGCPRDLGARRGTRPAVLGVLNGFLVVCGPLNAMYACAAGTASPMRGALLLLSFAAGTLPLLLSFGLLTSALGRAFRLQALLVTGPIVVAFGLLNIDRGAALAGVHPAWPSPRPAARSTVEPAGTAQQIMMRVTRQGWQPEAFVLTEGAPVRWVIHADSLSTCTERIVVPGLGLEVALHPGVNVVEFTPRREGVIPWSCWMGMLRGRFEVRARPATAH
jgi:sulfite exporter TauE/SafE